MPRGGRRRETGGQEGEGEGRGRDGGGTGEGRGTGRRRRGTGEGWGQGEESTGDRKGAKGSKDEGTRSGRRLEGRARGRAESFWYVSFSVRASGKRAATKRDAPWPIIAAVCEVPSWLKGRIVVQGARGAWGEGQNGWGPGEVSQGAPGAGQTGWVPSSVQSTQREPSPMVCTTPMYPPRVLVG